MVKTLDSYSLEVFLDFLQIAQVYPLQEESFVKRRGDDEKVIASFNTQEMDNKITKKDTAKVAVVFTRTGVRKSCPEGVGHSLHIWGTPTPDEENVIINMIMAHLIK